MVKRQRRTHFIRRGVRPGRHVRCVECGRVALDADDEDASFRYWSDGLGELMVFCVEYSAREFGLPTPAEGR